MKLAAIVALVRNDLRVHFADRRGVMINIAAAVFIAGFMGFLFGGSGKTKEVGRIPVAIAVEDESEVSEAIARTIAGDKMIDARRVSAAEARDLVRTGKAQAGFVLPKGFADAAGRAFFRGSRNPDARPQVPVPDAVVDRKYLGHRGVVACALDCRHGLCVELPGRIREVEHGMTEKVLEHPLGVDELIHRRCPRRPRQVRMVDGVGRDLDAVVVHLDDLCRGHVCPSADKAADDVRDSLETVRGKDGKRIGV